MYMYSKVSTYMYTDRYLTLLNKMDAEIGKLNSMEIILNSTLDIETQTWPRRIKKYYEF